MKVTVSDAKAQLTDLVRRAEAGEEVILTRHGEPAARLVPVQRPRDARSRQKVLEDILASAPSPKRGPGAARSQDFLYGKDGLPK